MNNPLRSIYFFLFLFTASFYKPQFAKAQNKPNIIIILADDMGYSDIGSFGSEIQTPNLDALAKNGLKMTQFYNASRCCPTRAALLTGLYPHQAGVGDMVNTRPIPQYQGYLNQNCVTIAEALKTGGYKTFMTGKWHVGEKRPHWPLDRGFNRYFGLINGANSYFDLRPYRPRQKLTIALDSSEYVPGKDYYATDVYTDFAIQFLEESKNDNQPFFLYMAYQAPHWPLHALTEDIKKYKGKYSKGWDAIRKERFTRMKNLGILPKDAKLSPKDEHVPTWETVTLEDKEEWETRMEVYAAMIDRMGQNIGKLRTKLKELGKDKNTLIISLSDNGASYEDIDGSGFTPEILAANKLPASNPASFTAYEDAGANVSNTPFRYYKHLEFEGGIATPFIAYYPQLIKKRRTSAQPAHVIDLLATCLDVAGVKYPTAYNNKPITPTEGISLKPFFEGTNWVGHDVIYFEHEGNRAVRQGNWKLVSNYPENKWYLYNIKKDRSELNDVSTKHPEKVAELTGLYQQWANRIGVVPFEQIDPALKK